MSKFRDIEVERRTEAIVFPDAPSIYINRGVAESAADPQVYDLAPSRSGNRDLPPIPGGAGVLCAGGYQAATSSPITNNVKPLRQIAPK